MWAVIPTRDRPGELAGLLSDLDPARTVIVDNGSEPPVRANVASLIRDLGDPPSISALWNTGLDRVAALAQGPYDVAVLNDDLRIPAGTLEAVSAAMRAHGCAAAFPDAHHMLAPGAVDVLTEPGPHNLFHRMTGYCFVLRGEDGLRADETMRWWYSDDDLEWRAAQAGGVARVGVATPVTHLHPNVSTGRPELAAQAAQDRARFVAKWGTPPW